MGNGGPHAAYLATKDEFKRSMPGRLVGVSVDSNSFGPALQVGVDIPVGKNLYVNFDVKKVYIRTDVSAAGSKLGTFKVDPLLVGVGLGWRF